MLKNIKKLFFLFAFLFLSFQIFASSGMNIIPLSSPIYDYVDALYTLEGHAAAEGSRPWTEADLKQQIDRITPTSEASKTIVDHINSYLNRFESNVSATWNLALTPSMAVHSNAQSFDESDKWVSDVLNDKLIKINLGLNTYDYFAANMGFSLGFLDPSTAIGDFNTKDFISTSNEARFNSTFATNIPFLSSGSIDIDITDNSFITVGTPYVSLTVARGELSWGNGLLGNLILSNTLQHHDYIRLSASNNSWFDYSMLVSFFTHPQNYYQDFTKELHGIQMFIAHRFEFRMFQDKLRLTLNEAIMYHSPDNTIDFRALSPLLILHGLYIPANANSLASVEVEYAPIKNLQLYASFVFDDLSVGGEAKAPAKDATLNMWGIMGGARGSVAYQKGYFSFNLETVYTSPFMYHKDSYNTEKKEMNYALDYVGSIRLQNGNYKRAYLSFPFGSDALAIHLGAAYTVPYHWSCGIKFFFMAHGVTNVNSVVKKYSGTEDYVPTFLATKNPWTGEEGEISYTYAAGLDGEYYFFENLSLSSSFNFIYVNNFENEKGRNEYDVQWTLSLKYSIF